jgi:S1-C subfamily serine protease
MGWRIQKLALGLRSRNGNIVIAPAAPRISLLRWLLVVAAALSVRCASAPAPTPASVVAVEQGRPLPAGSEPTSPLEFRKFVIKPAHERVVGAVQQGKGCSARAPLTWTSGRDGALGAALGELLLEEVSSAGYTVVGGSDELFEDPHGEKAEYVIAGVIRDIRANVCYATPRKRLGTAEASLAVDWQIYSHRSKAVELKATTGGSARLTGPQQEAGPEAVTRAFVSAARNLLADQRFHDLLTDAGPDRTGRPADPIPVAWEAPPRGSPGSVESVVADSRMGVVTVFAGDALGSGFVISPDGYLLTGQHVVGGSRHVRVKFLTGREVNGEVIRSDRRRDVALIKLESDVYKCLPLGESSRVQPGADVFAIGTPLAESFGQTVTRGVVSGYGEEDGLRILRSDVSVHRGNSGGPLLDRSGVVVGLSVSGFMLMPEGVGVGLNAFVPIEEALDALAIRRQAH